MLGYGFEVGGVIFGGHLDFAVPEAGEGGVVVEDVGAFGVDVEKVEGVRGAWRSGFRCGGVGL